MRIFAIILSLFLSFLITNTAFAATEVFGTLPGDTTWTLAESPYVITSDLSIPAGVTLTIEPGVVVKFGNQFTALEVSGTLSAVGTIESPIIFTSYKDDSVGGDTNGDGSASFPDSGSNINALGEWRGLFLSPGNVTQLTHAEVRYGGRSIFTGTSFFRLPMIEMSGGLLSITHTTLRPSTWTDVALNQMGGDTTITDSILTRKTIVVSGGTMSIHGSILATHSLILTNNTATTIDAIGNWWGDASGPGHSSNPDGSGSGVVGDVTVVPFLTADPRLATVTLSDTTTPATGSASAPIVFKVTYTNSFNQAPQSVRLVAEGENSPCPAIGGGGGISRLFVTTAYAAEGDGCAMELDASAVPTLRDGDYSNGEQYVLTQQFPVGNFTYHFEADDVRNPAFDENPLVVTDGPLPCAVECNSNVMFLPGIMGSRLYWTDPSCILINCENKLWIPNRNDDVEDLYMATGTSLLSNIYTKEDDILFRGGFILA